MSSALAHQAEAPEPLARRELLLGMIQKEFPSYHPLLSIARIAHSQDADLKLQFECHKTIAKYVEPEIKSIEVKGEVGHRHRVSVSLFEPVDTGFTPVIEGEKVPPALESQPGGQEILEAVVDGEVAGEVDRVVREW